MKRGVVGMLEKFFYHYGIFVANHPFLVILCAFVFAAASGVGIMYMTPENDNRKLWIPSDSASRYS